MPSAAFDMQSTTSTTSSGAVGGSAYVPGISQDLGPSNLPRISRRPQFMYFCHPERWQVIDGKLLPLPGKLKLQAGVMGVVPGRTRGSVSLRHVKGDFDEKRRTLIPFDSIPDTHAAPGQPKSYLRMIDAAVGKVPLSIYEQAFAGSSETRCDHPRWVEFLEHQLVTGLIEPPATWVLERMRDKRVKSLERMEANGSTNRAKRDRLEMEVRVISGVIEGRNDNATPVGGAASAPSVEGLED